MGRCLELMAIVAGGWSCRRWRWGPGEWKLLDVRGFGAMLAAMAGAMAPPAQTEWW